MPSSVSRKEKSTKKSPVTNVTQNRMDMTQIHPVIAIVRDRFGAENAVWELHKISKTKGFAKPLSESYCRKVLWGGCKPNFQLIVALLAQDWGKDALHALVPDASWVGKHKRLLSLDELNRKQLQIEQEIKSALLSEAIR